MKAFRPSRILNRSAPDSLGGSLQLAGGDGDLDDVGGDAGRVRAGGNLSAAAGESFELPVIQRGSLHRHVVTGVAVLAVGKDLDDLRAG
jgi:hypothetical protein